MTEADNGPFSGESPDDRLLLAQGFLGIASITMLVMSAVITERRRAEEAVKPSRAPSRRACSRRTCR